MSVASPPRRRLIRFVRYFVVHPAAILGAIALLLLGGALIVITPTLIRAAGLGAAPLASAPPATENYLRGNREYNADLMWASLSDQAQARYQATGSSQQDLARQMQAAKDRGLALQDVSYVGGKSLPNGTSLQFYVVAVKMGTGADLNYVPYLFTLDAQGKILTVE